MPALQEDTGRAGLSQMLRRLGTTARLMQTTAHPDDEDGGTLTYESRGLGAHVLLMTLNRGEGGQNKLGSGFSDGLGVLRTLELLAADQYYGVEQRFSRAADFGFSKTAEETFEKWGGHDPVLADMVRVIRTDRPDVLVARFSGTPRDGHGNHQASAILTEEAFRAAADPRRFPEQIAAGLQPWQARKLYIGNVCDFGAQSCPDANWTLKINSGKASSDLGMSYVQFAMKGLRHQQSQGGASWTVEPGDRFSFYKLVDSAATSPRSKEAHETNFFDGIDTSLAGLVDRYAPQNALPSLHRRLESAESLVGKATSESSADPESAAETLSTLANELRVAAAMVSQSKLSEANKAPLLQALNEKVEQAESALRLALNLQFSAEIAPLPGKSKGGVKEGDVRATVSPGEQVLVTAILHNGSRHSIRVKAAGVNLPADWKVANNSPVNIVTVLPGHAARWSFRVQVPLNPQFTRPYWHRTNPDVEGLNHVDRETEATLPFPTSDLKAGIDYSIMAAVGGKVSASHRIEALIAAPDGAGGTHERPVAVVPAFSVQLEPGTLVMNLSGDKAEVKVGVTDNGAAPATGSLRLELPTGWRSEPSQYDVKFASRGEKKDFTFALFPQSAGDAQTPVHAVFKSGESNYTEGYSLVTRDDLGSFYYYQPALLRVSTVAVKLPEKLAIGYVPGAGDDIAQVLKQLGMDVHVIPPDKLASEDLSRYGTIVLGIRAYDTQKEVASSNQRLLDWVSAGGTLIVQYNADTGNFNGGHFAAFPATLSRARVSVEEAPVAILAPQDTLFHYPNMINAGDFDGWVQERGLYFMSKWDDHFQPLLACHDPGEDEQKGGLLRAQYGKGTYIYTGYAFFRQLPVGVPGAVRLFVNLLSVGHEKR